MVSVHFDQDRALLTVKGQLVQQQVMQAWPEQQQALASLKAVNKVLKIDMKGLSQVDTAGLAWLVALQKSANQFGVKIEHIRAPQNLHKLANLSDLNELLPLEPI